MGKTMGSILATPREFGSRTSGSTRARPEQAKLGTGNSGHARPWLAHIACIARAGPRRGSAS